MINCTKCGNDTCTIDCKESIDQINSSQMLRIKDTIQSQGIHISGYCLERMFIDCGDVYMEFTDRKGWVISGVPCGMDIAFLFEILGRFYKIDVIVGGPIYADVLSLEF